MSTHTHSARRLFETTRASVVINDGAPRILLVGVTPEVVSALDALGPGEAELGHGGDRVELLRVGGELGLGELLDLL